MAQTSDFEAIQRAADQGDAEAQFNLGWMYDTGKGVSQDYGEAVQWYRRAADQGHAQAQCNLGVMYYTGEGVPQDDREAVKWFRRAADQGDAKAQYFLGWIYANGHGVVQDHREAYIWFFLAALTGDEGFVKYRDRIARLFSPNERRTAQAEAERRLQAIDKGRAGQTEDR